MKPHKKGFPDPMTEEIAGTAGGDLRRDVAESTSLVISHGLKGTATAVEVVADVASSVVRGALEVGHDLGTSVRGLLLGVLRGTRDSDRGFFDTIRDTSAVVIRTAAEAQGDVAAATQGLVSGALDAAREMDLDAASAVSAVARGAIEGADTIGGPVVERVGKIVKRALQPFQKEKLS